MNIEIGKELVAMADILERSGGSGDIIAYKGEVLVVENVIDDPEELDFVATVSLKYNKSVTPFGTVIRVDGDMCEIEVKEPLHDYFWLSLSQLSVDEERIKHSIRKYELKEAMRRHEAATL